MTKKEQTKQEADDSTKTKPLPPVEKKYQELANLNYITNAQARQDIIDIINEVEKIEGASMKKSSDHDLTILYDGKSLARICPLKKDYSASLGGGKIEKHTKADILKAITKGVDQRKAELEKARIEAEAFAEKERLQKAEEELKQKIAEEEKAKQESSKKAPSKTKK
jgi:hypothetical protein